MTVTGIAPPVPEPYVDRRRIAEHLGLSVATVDRLVRRLYGHRDRRLALDRVRSAYAQAGQVQSLPAARRLHTA